MQRRVQANNLVMAGFEVTVWNRNPDKCKPLQEAGAKVGLPERCLWAHDLSVSIALHCDQCIGLRLRG